MKTVWIINQYSPHPEKAGRVGLQLQLAKEMPKAGWKVQTVLASSSHRSGLQFLPVGTPTSLVEWEGTESLLVHARKYEANGIDRWINMAEFGVRLFFRRTLSKLSKPDIIVGRITNPLAALAAMRWARRFGVPFVLEISDIWPDTFIQLGAWPKSGIKTHLLRTLEQRLIRASAAVMSPLPGVGKYLQDSGFEDKPFYWVPNGADVSNRVARPSVPNSESDGFVFMYAGSLGNANAVDTIIDAFDRYVQETSDSNAVLEIVGDGTLKKSLEGQAANLASGSQIHFRGRVSPERMPEQLRRADALVANMRDLPLYNYGIGLNKLFDYLLSGRPIIFASNAINNIVEEARAGICVHADDEIAVAAAMGEMVKIGPTRRSHWGELGRDFVINNYTYAHSAERFRKMLLDLTLRR